MTIFLASDHAGFELKQQIYLFLIENDEFKNHLVVDLGPQDKNSVDFPDFADKLCQRMKTNSEAYGILICGSGQGMAMRANKYPFMRAALVYSDEIASLSREHNNANAICLGSRFSSIKDAKSWVKLFLNTAFAGGRHQTRVAKIGSVLS